MRIVTNHFLPSTSKTLLRAVGDLDVPEVPGDAAVLRARIEGADAFMSLLTDRVDAALLDAAGASLKIVANVAVGFDNIDVAAARARGVIVTNTPGVLTEATAQLTWALILAVTRRLSEGDRLVRSGRWAGWTPELLPGMELTGKQLGIVGGGRIGRAVAAKAGVFGMHVVFASRAARGEIDGHPVVSLDELLVSSDVVSLHVPLSDASRHLIDKRALARMKRSAFLINTARGPIVDEQALEWALDEGLIAGAGLDVYEREPFVSEALRASDRVMFTPHLGSATRETRLAMSELAARNIVAVLSGQAPLTPVPGSFDARG